MSLKYAKALTKIGARVKHRILNHTHNREPDHQVEHQVLHLDVTDMRQPQIRTATNIKIHPDATVPLTHDDQCAFNKTSMVTPRKPYEIKVLGFITMILKPASVPVSQAALPLRKLYQPKQVRVADPSDTRYGGAEQARSKRHSYHPSTYIGVSCVIDDAESSARRSSSAMR
jgi:hypothetical protein